MFIYTIKKIMKIEQKSPEVIQAQVAAFTLEGVEDGGYFRGREHDQVFRNIGTIAAGAVVDHEYVVNHQVDNYETGETYEQPTAYTVPAEDYVTYLRRHGASTNEAVRRRADYLHAYAEFKPQVQDAIASIAEASRSDREQHSTFVGSGTNASAHAFQHNGKDYIAKIIHHKDSNGAKASDDRFTDLERGKNLHPRLEQLVAMSYEDGIAVIERMSGKDLWQADQDDIEAVTNDQLTRALDVMKLAQGAGLHFDPKPSNYMYSKEDGFGFIDYSPQDKNHPIESYAEKVAFFAEMLSDMGPYFEMLQTKEQFITTAVWAPHRIGLLHKYREVCMAQPDQDEYRLAIKTIDNRITDIQKTAQNVETPGWLENHFAEEAARKQRLREHVAQMQRNKEAGIPDLV